MIRQFPLAAPLKHGSAIARVEGIDRQLIAIADVAGGRESQYPTLIDRDVLERAEYSRGFPHLLMLAGAVANIDAVVSGTERAVPYADSSWCLSPAVCYHVYAELAGRRLEAPLMVTARGQCFRHESACAPYVRQLEFGMREFVLLGSRQWVRRTMQSVACQVESLAITLGLRGTWQPASDPFFLPSAQGKALMQRLRHVKREYCSDAPAGLALASVNDHQMFFGERFSITSGDREPVHSACIAIGLDRWLGVVEPTLAASEMTRGDVEEVLT